MELAQLEQVLSKWANGILEIWFANNPLLLPLAKTLVTANMYHIRELTKMVTDEHGNVIIDELLKNYEQAIPADGLKINFATLLGDNILTRNISIKVLERSDIQQLKTMLKI